MTLFSCTEPGQGEADRGLDGFFTLGRPTRSEQEGCEFSTGKLACSTITIELVASQNQQRLAEARMMARNRCLLAQKTMEALSMITSDTWKPFVVESIVQRMANMLNYVLKLLVGAKSRELKVSLLN